LLPTEQNFNIHPATFQIKVPLAPCFLQNCHSFAS
jgi:hypothetical protein